MRKNAKKIRPFLLTMMAVCLVFSGCRGNKEKEEEDAFTPRYTLGELREEAEQLEPEYLNMDFSEADIMIPEEDSIEELIFTVDQNIAKKDTYEKIKDNFYENIRQLTGKRDVNEDGVYLKVHPDDDPIPINDVEDSDRERSAGSYEPGDPASGYYFFSYNDSKHSLLLYGNSFMLEMAGERVAGYSKRWDWLGYRPPEEGTIKKRFKLPKDSIENVSYPVNGKQYALSDAVAYVEENMGKGYHYVRSPFLTYQVCSVDVVKLEEDNYYYDMKVKALYHGISFSYEENSETYPVGRQEVDFENYAITHQVVVMAESSIDYIWSCMHSYEEKQAGEIYTKFLSIKDAMDLVGRTISASAKFKCDRVELMYRPEFYKDELGYMKEVKCRPVYHFTVPHTGLAEHPYLYFDVDAVTGFVYASNA